MNHPPQNIDLRTSPILPSKINHQGEFNTCTAQAIATGAYAALYRAKVKQEVEPSPLFLHYNACATQYPDPGGWQPHRYDGKMLVRMIDCLRALGRYGICTEKSWPYSKEYVSREPSQEAYQEAAAGPEFQYTPLLPELSQLKSCLASGYPFAFGFLVFKSYTSDAVARTGIIPFPGTYDKRIGAHALLAVGYDDARRHFIVRNSFGNEWGENGYGYFPYNYMVHQLHYAFDYWTIHLESQTIEL